MTDSVGLWAQAVLGSLGDKVCYSGTEGAVSGAQQSRKGDSMIPCIHLISERQICVSCSMWGAW